MNIDHKKEANIDKKIIYADALDEVNMEINFDSSLICHICHKDFFAMTTSNYKMLSCDFKSKQICHECSNKSSFLSRLVKKIISFF